jgi:hypothetical protein
MKLRIELAEGCYIPKWYGFAYSLDYANKIYCYPIPINILARFYHVLHLYVKKGLIGRLSFEYYIHEKIRKAKQEGYRSGYDDGYELGLKHYIEILGKFPLFDMSKKEEKQP